jgi:hypothetical protein
MSYYILQKGFELCGWKGLPFALRYPNPHFTDFFDEEAYRVVYALDGQLRSRKTPPGTGETCAEAEKGRT